MRSMRSMPKEAGRPCLHQRRGRQHARRALLVVNPDAPKRGASPLCKCRRTFARGRSVHRALWPQWAEECNHDRLRAPRPLDLGRDPPSKQNHLSVSRHCAKRRQDTSCQPTTPTSPNVCIVHSTLVPSPSFARLPRDKLSYVFLVSARALRIVLSVASFARLLLQQTCGKRISDLGPKLILFAHHRP